MHKKSSRLFVSVLLLGTILLGQLFSLPQFLPLKASEKDQSLVKVALDGEEVAKENAWTREKQVLVSVTGEKSGFYQLPITPKIQVTPVLSYERPEPLSDPAYYLESTFDVDDWQASFFEAQTEVEQVNDSMEEVGDSTGFSTVENKSKSSDDLKPEVLPPVFTLDEKGTTGALYFYLERGETQSFLVKHLEEKDISINIQNVPFREEKGESLQQTLYSYRGLVGESQRLLEIEDEKEASASVTVETEGDLSESSFKKEPVTSLPDKEQTQETGDASSQQDDQSALSRFEIFTDKDTYLVGEQAVGYVALTMNQGTGNLKDAVIEIRIPKTFIAEKPRGSSFALASNVELDETDPDDYIIRYQVPIIEAGYEGQIPFSFKVSAGMTPKGYKLPITAVIKDANEVEQAKAETKVPYTTNDPTLTKYVKSDTGSWTSINGEAITIGSKDPDNPDYFPGKDQLDLLTPVSYRFHFLNDGLKTTTTGRRTFEYWEIIDKLPEGALFRTEDNPEWSYNPDTREVTYRGDLTFSTTGALLNNYSPELKLYYPEAKLDQRFTNTGSATFTPYQKPDYEEKIVKTDDIYHTVVELKRPTGYIVSKMGGGSVYDVLEEKEKYIVSWQSYIYNPSNTTVSPEAMENLVIRDYNQDNQLAFKEVRVWSSSISSNSENLTKPENYHYQGTVTLTALLEDGSMVLLTEDYVPMYSGTTQSYSSPWLTIPADTKEILMTSNKGGTLAPGGSVNLMINSVYRDPEKTTLKDPTVRGTMRNYAQFSGNYVNGGHQWTGSGNGYHTLKPINPYIALIKSRNGPSPTFVYDMHNYTLDMRHFNDVPNQRVESPVLLDLLPVGFNYIPGSANITRPSGTRYIYDESIPSNKEPEIIPDFEGTGRTALRWRLSSYYSNQSTIGSSYAIPYRITYQTQVTELAQEGSNTNNAYLGWDNNNEIRASSTASGGTTDIYDVNENGDRTDKIAADSKTVDYRSPIELIATKEVQGNLDNGYVFNPQSGKTEIASSGFYRLRVLNNSLHDAQHVEILDVLPFVGDKTVGKDDQGNPYNRESEFPVTLSGPIQVPLNYKAYYSMDSPTQDDYGAFYETATWQETVLDFSLVRAFKVVLNEEDTFYRGDRLQVTVPINAAKDYELTTGQKANNSFGVSTDPFGSTSHRYFESNNAAIEIVRYKVKGTVFHDKNLDSTIGDLMVEPRFDKHLVVLIDEEGQPVLNLEGQPITALTDTEGKYEMDIFRQGMYRIRVLPPESYVLTTPKDGETQSNIYYEIFDEEEATYQSKSFPLNPTNPLAIRNAGFYKPTRPIYLYKYDESTLTDTNGNGEIDDADRRQGTPLSGAVFEIYEGDVVDPAKQLKDEDGQAIQIVTGADGKSSFDGKLSGDYVLVEVKAPEGFELAKEPIILKNVDTEMDSDLWIYIGNREQTELPFTGSNRPIEQILIVFTFLMLSGMFASAYLFYPRRKGGV
ncbi:SpaA isopeptide-forming pilin-related protein [Enterococcus sp. LJL98]